MAKTLTWHRDFEDKLFTCLFPASGGCFVLKGQSIADHLHDKQTQVYSVSRLGVHGEISHIHTRDKYGNTAVTMPY